MWYATITSEKQWYIGTSYYNYLIFINSYHTVLSISYVSIIIGYFESLRAYKFQVLKIGIEHIGS